MKKFWYRFFIVWTLLGFLSLQICNSVVYDKCLSSYTPWRQVAIVAIGPFEGVIEIVVDVVSEQPIRKFFDDDVCEKATINGQHKFEQ